MEKEELYNEAWRPWGGDMQLDILIAVCAAVIQCLEAQGCRMVTLEEQMDELCDPARHVRR
jgi:hypothetical protein